MDNSSEIDDQSLLKSFFIELEDLETLTGLLFDLGKCKQLEEHPVCK